MTQFSYKFGVMLCLEGQTTEEEMLQNNEQPEEFVEFLGWLGKTIDLKGFDGFSGYFSYYCYYCCYYWFIGLVIFALSFGLFG